MHHYFGRPGFRFSTPRSGTCFVCLRGVRIRLRLLTSVRLRFFPNVTCLAGESVPSCTDVCRFLLDPGVSRAELDDACCALLHCFHRDTCKSGVRGGAFYCQSSWCRYRRCRRCRRRRRRRWYRHSPASHQAAMPSESLHAFDTVLPFIFLCISIIITALLCARFDQLSPCAACLLVRRCGRFTGTCRICSIDA